MKNIFAIFLLINLINIKLFAADWDIDISQCRKVVERFFYNDKENKVNSPTYYYDKNNNLVLRVLFDEQGAERARGVFIYNNENELVEYSYWDRSSKNAAWNRWEHGVVDKVILDDRIIFYERQKIYHEDYKIVKETIKDLNGNLISTKEGGDDGYYLYEEYNNKGDVIFKKYENEKSDGMREETYIIEYDSNSNKINIKTYESGNLTIEKKNSYNQKKLLIQTIIINYLKNETSKQVYKYNANNKLLEEKYLDSNDNEIFLLYNEYDEKDRLIKHGEKNKAYNRYWTYEYFE